MAWSAPDDPTPDTAMASGADAGEPGVHLGPGDLAPDEERLLAALERDAGRGIPVLPEEPFAVVHAEDEGPAERGGPADDGLNPLFLSPGEG